MSHKSDKHTLSPPDIKCKLFLVLHKHLSALLVVEKRTEDSITQKKNRKNIHTKKRMMKNRNE